MLATTSPRSIRRSRRFVNAPPYSPMTHVSPSKTLDSVRYSFVNFDDNAVDSAFGSVYQGEVRRSSVFGLSSLLPSPFRTSKFSLVRLLLLENSSSA